MSQGLLHLKRIYLRGSGAAARQEDPEEARPCVESGGTGGDKGEASGIQLRGEKIEFNFQK